MSENIDQLSRELFQLEIGHPEDPSGGHHPETPRLHMLVDAVEGYEMGEYDINFLRQLFATHGPKGFSIDAWIGEQVKAGNYGADAFEPHEPDDEEDLGPNVVPFIPRLRSV